MSQLGDTDAGTVVDLGADRLIQELHLWLREIAKFCQISICGETRRWLSPKLLTKPEGAIKT